MDKPPEKQAFDIKQWLKDYGVFAALISAALFLGIPSLYRLGAMSEQLRHLDTTIREDLKPELRALREEVKLLRVGFAEVRTKIGTVEQIVVRIETKMGELAKDLQKSP